MLTAAASQCADLSTAIGAEQADAGMTPCRVQEEQIELPARPATLREILAVKTFFSNVLNDGPSARWKVEGVWRGGFICGKVNSKNSFGAYAGWSRFYYRNHSGEIVDGDRQNWNTPERIPCLLPSLGSGPVKLLA